MALPVLLLALDSTIRNTLAHGTFHQLRLLATSTAFHNLHQLLLVGKYVGKLWTNHNVLINKLYVLLAQIKAQTLEALIHVFLDHKTTVNCTFDPISTPAHSSDPDP